MKKNSVHSEETKQKIANALKGRKRCLSQEWIDNIKQAAFNRRGIKTGPRTEEVKRKISEGKKGKKLNITKVNPTWFKKGHIPAKPFKKGQTSWIKGKCHTKETIAKISTTRKAKAKGRGTSRTREWRQEVLKNAGFACEKCGATENLHAHHIIPWKENESLRFDLSNGMTLCGSCHAQEEGYQNGHSPSLEIRKKMGAAAKGRPAWNKGKKLTEEHKAKSEKSRFKKGLVPWNKGKRKQLEQFKICNVCGIEKPLQRFTPNQAWFSHKCKDCRNNELTKKRANKKL